MSNKKKYLKPLIEWVEINHEHCIAAGSAKIKPQNAESNQVIDEWTELDSDNRTIDW
ncbi:hypothetical protein PQ465_07455 [Sphingobacterium oryzagri]|uniref:DUF2281 domain-containing protein n=1 Tax=Sphingobacterium oryzagri TaxID=3025669 RepID=A0ABY7WL19_9SPHI|nr:hypothetical protein [Sphingobacterium sp. KACC 22765]WDF70205.1 hypothetical protein PQ465_07455 [Sphingobacterium sp. KACC 22765]